MPSNRDYTGLIRTPSSMVWLIGHRAKIKGQLDRLKRMQGTLPDKIRAAEAELAAIDAVIPLHEVKVDPGVIKGVKPKGPAAAAHGVLTRFLLKQLRVAAGKPLYTTELALNFARERAIDPAILGHAEIMDRVGKRLRVLTAKGLVCRHHAKETRGMGQWSLVDEDHGHRHL